MMISKVLFASAATLITVAALWEIVKLDTSRAEAQSDYDRCIADSTPAEVRLAACNDAIGSGDTSNRSLAVIYLNRGNVWYLKRDLDRALADYGEAARLDPSYSRPRVGRGNILRDQQRLDQALAEYDHALRLDSRNLRVFTNRAQLWMTKGDPRKAIADLDEAVKINPKDAAIHYDRGQAWFQLGDHTRARADFDQAISLAPNNPTYLQMRGWTWFVTRNTERALADLDEAIRFAPTFAHAYFQRANVLVSLSQLDRALADYDDAIRLVDESSSPFYLYHRGLLLSRKREFDRAIADYDAAIRIDTEGKRRNPAHVNCCFSRPSLLYVVRGETREAMGQSDLAIVDFDEARRIDPKDTRALTGRGLSLYAKREYDRAIADYSEAIELDAKAASPYLGRATVWHAKKQYDRAILDYSEIIKLLPDSSIGFLNRAKSWAAAGRIEEAISDYLTAIRLSPDDADAHSRLGRLYSDHGRFTDAEVQYKLALAAREKAVDAIHLDVAYDLHNLAWITSNLGHYGEAASLYERAVAIYEQLSGKEHQSVASALAYLGAAYVFQGRYGEADSAYKRALDIAAKNPQIDSQVQARIDFGLGNLYFATRNYRASESAYERALSIYEKGSEAELYVATTLIGLGNARWQAGKYTESAEALERALLLNENVLGVTHPQVALNLESLAITYRALGRLSDAEGLLQRSLAIREQRFGPNNPEVAHGLHTLADTYREQGKYSQARELYTRALAIREQALGPKHADTAQTLQNLADTYRGQGKYAEAEAFYNRALTIQEDIGSASSVGMVWTLIGLASIHKSNDQYDKALELLERALAIAEATFGPSHPNLAYLLDDLAILHRAMGNNGQALAYSRRASASILAHATEQSISFARKEGYGGLVEQRADYFVRHVFDLVRVAQEKPDQDSVLGREAFEIAQWGNLSRAAAAVQQMGARFASGNDALASLVRQSQDLTAVLRDRNHALIEALSKTADQRDQAVENIRRELADAEGRFSEIARELEANFPDYVTLAQPRPLKVEQVQRLLGPDDALVFFLIGNRSGIVFALTHDDFSWKSVPLGTSDFNSKVADLRRGLEVEVIDRMYDKIDDDRADKLFDLELAHGLYKDLLLPVEALIKEKAQLIVVPSGALTSLPFHLLVTEEPLAAVPERFAGYREASWLIKRQAVSIIPAVTSMQTLQGTSRADAGAKPMIGFGDPVFDRNEPEIAALPPGTSVTRSYADFWRGAGIDRAELSRLPRLRDTSDELKNVARRLGAKPTDVRLRADASETAVKRLPLADYRVIYFATHGLVAGDVEGIAEPALALSTPANPTDDDDGLLTASEVAQLKLNADWVVLSACNTVAGEKPGAEALSGLARAFFYSGARSLLVSHWRVDSFAATALTTTTFEFLERDPTLGRSEALRRAMLAFMNDAADPRRAYPALWAPFVIIGRDAPAHGNGSRRSAPPASLGRRE